MKLCPQRTTTWLWMILISWRGGHKDLNVKETCINPNEILTGARIFFSVHIYSVFPQLYCITNTPKNQWLTIISTDISCSQICKSDVTVSLALGCRPGSLLLHVSPPSPWAGSYSEHALCPVNARCTRDQAKPHGHLFNLRQHHVTLSPPPGMSGMPHPTPVRQYLPLMEGPTKSQGKSRGFYNKKGGEEWGNICS